MVRTLHHQDVVRFEVVSEFAFETGCRHVWG